VSKCKTLCSSTEGGRAYRIGDDVSVAVKQALLPPCSLYVVVKLSVRVSTSSYVTFV
jgi:hypothetical protein